MQRCWSGCGFSFGTDLHSSGFLSSVLSRHSFAEHKKKISQLRPIIQFKNPIEHPISLRFREDSANERAKLCYYLRLGKATLRVVSSRCSLQSPVETSPAINLHGAWNKELGVGSSCVEDLFDLRVSTELDPLLKSSNAEIRELRKGMLAMGYFPIMECCGDRKQNTLPRLTERFWMAELHSRAGPLANPARQSDLDPSY